MPQSDHIEIALHVPVALLHEARLSRSAHAGLEAVMGSLAVHEAMDVLIDTISAPVNDGPDAPCI